MERIKPRTLSGFAELLPEQQLQFQAVMATLEPVSYTHLDVYKRQVRGLLKTLDKYKALVTSDKIS